MSARPTGPRREPRLLRILALPALLLQACAVAPPAAPAAAATRSEPGAVIGRDADFVVVLAQPGDDLASLAERYLGDARKGWWIGEFNDIATVRPGQDVVIPLKAPNPIGVFADAYQTVPILCYHRFGINNRGKLVTSAAAFEAQMDYLAKNGFRVVPLAQLPGFLDGVEPLPRKSVVITIDDGYRSTYDIAFPILKKYKFPATIFLYSDFVGAADAMTWGQMQEMARSGLIDVQPHSKSHSNLVLKSPRETDAQYRERVRLETELPSKAIQERLSLGTYVFAYPYGDTNEHVMDRLARQGVQLGFTVTPGGNGFFAYPYMLRRTMIYGDDNLETFKSKLAVSARKTAR